MNDTASNHVALVKSVPLGDIIWLFLGSSLVAVLAIFLVKISHGSQFTAVVVALSIGNLWYLVRYAWLSPRRGWLDLRQRFAPIDHRVLLGCMAAAAAMILVYRGIEAALHWAGIELAQLPSPPFALSHFSQVPAAVIAIAIIGPLAEELLFRGLLLDWMRQRMRTWCAVVAVSVIFSLAHGISIKSGTAGWLQCGYRVLMGMIAAALTVKFQSLRPSLVFHATINCVGVLGMALAIH